jgi:protein NRD1
MPRVQLVRPTWYSLSFEASSHTSYPDTSTTPPGSPPPNLLASLGTKPPAAAPAPAQSGQSILDALANIARQNTTAPASTPNLPAPAASFNLPGVLAGLSQPAQPSAPQAQPPHTASYHAGPQAAVNAPVSLPFSIPSMSNSAAPPPAASNFPNAAPGGPPVAGGALDPNTQQQILLIKALADQGIPFDKIPALLQSMSGGAGANAGAPAQAQAPNPSQQSPYVPGQPWGAAAPKQEQNRDWYGNDGVRSPRYGGGRSRSRSPDRGWGRGSDRNGRDRVDYGRNSPQRGRDDDRNRRGGEYRDRSPPRRHGQSPPPGAKWTDFDPNLPDGSIKVLSRTLFVGGVT